MSYTFYAINLGCRVNRAELESWQRRLFEKGFVEDAGSSVVLINTCCVTQEAFAKSKHAIRQAIRRPLSRCIVITGCAVNLYEEELAALAQEYDVKVCIEPNKNCVVDHLVNYYAAQLTTQKQQESLFDKRFLRARPNIVVQNGCNHRCTYCCVWQARGPARSLNPSAVLEEIEHYGLSSYGEVVLCGIDVGSYSVTSEQKKYSLAQLIDFLLEKTSISRIRLSSVEPVCVNADLLSVMACSDGRVAPYLHLPLQSGSDEILAAMRRPYTSAQYLSVVDTIKEAIPHISLSTDIICGFPSETPIDHKHTLALVKKVGFSKLHVFRYSRRSGTPAAYFENQVPQEVKGARAQEMRELGNRLRIAAATAAVGTIQHIALETDERGMSDGLFVTRLLEPRKNAHSCIRAKIVGNEGDVLVARPLN